MSDSRERGRERERSAWLGGNCPRLMSTSLKIVQQAAPCLVVILARTPGNMCPLNVMEEIYSTEISQFLLL